MKPDAIDRELQEFLDGRMSEKARTAFENRLAQDRDLARRVATGREVGRALRAGDEQVSLGFYTRARARFEASRRGRDWFRLLSWETAGLAAAVAIAGVLFLPSLFMSERPGQRRLPGGDDCARSGSDQDPCRGRI
jgi:anti-sigma factor RsiW